MPAIRHTGFDPRHGKKPSVRASDWSLDAAPLQVQRLLIFAQYSVAGMPMMGFAVFIVIAQGTVGECRANGYNWSVQHCIHSPCLLYTDQSRG
jgi:hypothetical protein